MFDVINAFMAILGYVVLIIALAITWKQRNNFRDLYIEARTDYLREINERRVSARDTTDEKESGNEHA